MSNMPIFLIELDQYCILWCRLAFLNTVYENPSTAQDIPNQTCTHVFTKGFYTHSNTYKRSFGSSDFSWANSQWLIHGLKSLWKYLLQPKNFQIAGFSLLAHIPRISSSRKKKCLIELHFIHTLDNFNNRYKTLNALKPCCCRVGFYNPYFSNEFWNSAKKAKNVICT